MPGGVVLGALVNLPAGPFVPVAAGLARRTTRQVPSGDRYSRWPWLSSWWWGISLIVPPSSPEPIIGGREALFANDPMSRSVPQAFAGVRRRRGGTVSSGNGAHTSSQQLL